MMDIALKSQERVRVLAFGTFDIVHPGHVDFLKNARKLGDELFVIIALDSTVAKRKGRSPQFSEEIRKAHVEHLKIADVVFLGQPKDYLHIPKLIDPDVIALGYDQQAPIRILKQNFPHVKITRLSSHFPQEFKSSKMRDIFPKT